MGLVPQLIKELLPLSAHAYNLRSTYELKLENVHTVLYGTESLSFLVPKIWELVPLEMKSSHSLKEFKKKTNPGSQKILDPDSVNPNFII